jgi:hypothetical protein
LLAEKASVITNRLIFMAFMVFSPYNCVDGR